LLQQSRITCYVASVMQRYGVVSNGAGGTDGPDGTAGPADQDGVGALTGAVVAVIGDVVGSRRHPDRAGLQAQLAEALAATSPPDALQALTPTVGDEFQGLFRGLDQAINATLELRVRLLERIDLRFGIGRGEVATVTTGVAPFGQDGPGWWRAREALDAAEERSRAYGWPPTVRTVFASGRSGDGVVNAHLLLRDHIVGSMDALDAEIMLGLAAGETQTALASRLGMDKSSVSRRVAHHGLSTLLKAPPCFDEAHW
jgi:hypothetical protein